MANMDSSMYRLQDTETDEEKRDCDSEHTLHITYKPALYHDLNFAKKVKDVNVDLSKVNLDQRTFTGSKTGRKTVQNRLEEFERHLKKRTVIFKDYPDLELNFDENGEAHNHIRLYLKKKKGEYHLQLHKDNQGIPYCIIYSLNQSVCNRIANYIVFDRHPLTRQDVQKNIHLSDFIKKKEKEGTLKVVSTSGKDSDSIVICCIKKISKALSKHISEQVETVPLADHYMSFLETYGKDLLRTKAEELHVNVSIDSSNRTMSIVGDKESIKIFKDHFGTMFHKAYITLPDSASAEEVSLRFDRIADTHECTWSLCLLNQPELNRLEGCDYLTTVYHPIHPGTLSCITGSVSTLRVDAVILLVTDKLGVLHKFSAIDSAMYHIYNPDPAITYCLLDCVQQKTLGMPFSSVLGLVIEYANYSVSERLRENVMDKLLDAIKKHNVKTVCLPVSVMQGTYSTEVVVKAFVDVLIRYKWEEKDVHFYLCFDEATSQTHAHLVEETTRRFNIANRGFSRKTYGQPCGQALPDNDTVTIKAVRNSLQGVTTEAIVNPSSVDLQLDKGYVSSSLLEAAGQGMTTFCSAKYPKGIPRNDVAVTPPFTLKELNRNLKHVLHAALPQFDITSYQQDIKRLTRLCLLKAEENGCKSIAFPALGTGRHGNPSRETIKVMFDAFVEYRDESLNPAVTTIVFAVPDDDGFRVFEDEEQRHRDMKSSIPYLPKKQNFKFLEGVFKKRGTVSIIFAMEHHFEEVPAYSVDVTFRQDMTCKWQFKPSFSQPWIDHDQLEVKLQNATKVDEKVKSTIKSCLEICKMHRFTEICLNKIKEQDLETAAYYQAVVDAILDFTQSSSDFHYIHKVYIQVTGQELQLLESHFLGSKPSIVGSLMSSFFWRRFNWQSYTGLLSRKPLQVEILGKSRESVSLVKRELSDKLRDDARTPTFHIEDERSSGITKDYSTLGARPKHGNIEATVYPDDSQANNRNVVDYDNDDDDANDDYDDDDDDENDDVDDDDDDSDQCDEAQKSRKQVINTIFRQTVSAEINPGFIEFKRRYKDLERWLGKVQIEFKISINQHPNNLYKVKGSYKAISAFKCYLDIYFPRDPNKRLRKKIYASVENEVRAVKIGIAMPPEHSVISIKMEALEANAFIRLYACHEVTGVKKWDYDSEKMELNVFYQTDDENELKADIKNRLADIYKDECSFDNPDDFMRAESEVMNLDKENQIFVEVVPQDSKIILFGREKASLVKATNSLNVEHKTKPLDEASSSTKHVDDFFLFKAKQVKIKIYLGDIKDIPVDAIVFPVNKNPNISKGLQKIILESAGPDVRQEYERLFPDSTWLQDGEYKTTSAGRLKYRHLFHVYLPKLKKDRGRNIDQINFLEEVLVTCFNAAEKEKLKSIGMPFIGSGKTGYQIEICAQQYFRAITDTEWKPKHLEEIHFVSNIEEQVKTVKQMFNQFKDDEPVDYTWL